MEVVADDPLLFPELAGHAGSEVAPEEVEALSALLEVDHTGLVRVEGETEVAKERSCELLACSASAWDLQSTTKSSA
jgi:hypothetical protein